MKYKLKSDEKILKNWCWIYAKFSFDNFFFVCVSRKPFRDIMMKFSFFANILVTILSREPWQISKEQKKLFKLKSKG